MKTMEIYYYDLSNEAQKEFDKIFGESDAFNHLTTPLFIYQVEDGEDETEIVNE